MLSVVITMIMSINYFFYNLLISFKYSLQGHLPTSILYTPNNRFFFISSSASWLQMLLLCSLHPTCSIGINFFLPKNCFIHPCLMDELYFIPVRKT